VKRLFLQNADCWESVPQVIAPFAPPGQPLLSDLILGMGTTRFLFAGYSGLVTTLISTFCHVAFLSSHRANASIDCNVNTLAYLADAGLASCPELDSGMLRQRCDLPVVNLMIAAGHFMKAKKGGGRRRPFFHKIVTF
jgi:hypothetical protein